MALHDLTRKMTYEDYVLIPEDGKRHEIIDGEHYASAVPSIPHQDLVVELTFRLAGFVKAHRLGKLLVAPTDVLLSVHDIVQPDLLFVSKERAEIVGLENLKGAPDLVVEILSKGTRRLDERIKLEAYERCGVREYWLFDRFRKGVQVWERAVEGFRQRPFLSSAAGDVLTSPLLPGLEFPLAEIFEA
jgi:Uma2 family endonuclease